MRTVIADFKPLNYFQWKAYIKQQVKREYKLENGFTYSDLTKCIYEPNGSLHAINAFKDEEEIFADVFHTCPQCEGNKNYEEWVGCTRHASECCGGCTDTRYCTDCDSNGQVLIEETFKTI